MKKIAVCFLMALAACSAQKKAATVPSSADMIVPGKLFASLFQQRAAEYRALCFQAYNLARLRVDQLPAGSKPKAIITDVDETVLDNSPYAVHQGLQGKDYEPASWHEWTAKAACDTVPGAPSFFKYAASRGIEVFYITNRDEQERAATLKNLQQYDFPNADNAHLLLKQTTSDKEARRQQVAVTHDIVMLVGDNLADHFSLYRKNYQERQAATDRLTAQFGARYIVLPNPAYGDWEGALLPANTTLTPAQKDSVMKSWLKGY
ncbi:MAG: 5'-nucleotidase, lipoprotein e(P4) family [Chitinophagaceae bacterium]